MRLKYFRNPNRTLQEQTQNSVFITNEAAEVICITTIADRHIEVERHISHASEKLNRI